MKRYLLNFILTLVILAPLRAEEKPNIQEPGISYYLPAWIKKTYTNFWLTKINYVQDSKAGEINSNILIHENGCEYNEDAENKDFVCLNWKELFLKNFDMQIPVINEEELESLTNKKIYERYVEPFIENLNSYEPTLTLQQRINLLSFYMIKLHNESLIRIGYAYGGDKNDDSFGSVQAIVQLKKRRKAKVSAPPLGYDCSGFVYSILSSFFPENKIPRNALAFRKFGQKIDQGRMFSKQKSIGFKKLIEDINKAQPGDIISYSDHRSPNHVVLIGVNPETGTMGIMESNSGGAGIHFTELNPNVNIRFDQFYMRRPLI